MEKSAMLDKALELIMSDLDDMEGKSAMSHSMDECPDPLTCGEHDSELGSSLSSEVKPGEEDPAAVKIEISKMGLPSMDGGKAPSLDDKGEDGEGLSPEDAEILKKLLSK